MIDLSSPDRADYYIDGYGAVWTYTTHVEGRREYSHLMCCGDQECLFSKDGRFDSTPSELDLVAPFHDPGGYLQKASAAYCKAAGVPWAYLHAIKAAVEAYNGRPIEDDEIDETVPMEAQ